MGQRGRANAIIWEASDRGELKVKRTEKANAENDDVRKEGSEFQRRREGHAKKEKEKKKKRELGVYASKLETVRKGKERKQMGWNGKRETDVTTVLHERRTDSSVKRMANKFAKTTPEYI